MIVKAISPLRQRMIEDMTARHFTETASVAAFLGAHPIPPPPKTFVCFHCT